MYSVIIVPHFKRQLKPFVKKYPDFKEAVITLLEHFDPRLHDHLGNGIYKARLQVKSLQKGKSKSFRLITLLIEREATIVPVAVYFKGDRATLSKEELELHLQKTLSELKD